MLSVTEAACHSIYETLEQRAAPSAAAPTLNVPTTLSTIYRDMVSRDGHERRSDMKARSQPSGGWTNPAARVRVDWRQTELAAKVRFASKC